MSDLRVLHVLGKMQPGGIQAFLVSLHRELQQCGIQFDYLLKSDGPDYFDGEITALGGRVYHFPYNGNLPVVAQRKLEFFFEAHSYEIVHCHFGFLRNMSPLIAARKVGVPTRILHAHSAGSQWKGPKEKAFALQHLWNKRFSLGEATDLFACSERSAEWFGYGGKGEPWRYIPNGIDCERFAFDAKARKEKRKELGLTQEDICVGHVGRLTALKNHAFLLRVFCLLKRRNPSVKLLLVGDGELRGAIEDQVRTLALSDSVIMTGSRSDLRELYSAMDVFAFPSLFEGLGMALVEAQANGLPSVSSNGIPSEAFVCESAHAESCMNEEVWASSLERALALGRDEGQLQSVKNAGFDIREVAQFLCDFYREKAGAGIGAE